MTPRVSLLPIVEFGAKLAGTVGRKPDLDTFLKTLPESPGPSGIGRDDIAEPLGVLWHSLEQEAALSAFGRLAARWDINRFLGNLARFQEEEARDPAILDEEIEAPIIITGLPRTGSTYLHGLLSEDPEIHVLRTWQPIYPYPLSAQDGDARPRKVDRQLRGFTLLAPETRDVCPFDGWSPQECTELTAHVFQSLRFDTTHHVPSYRAWLDRQGSLAAYRCHKRFLQHLQHQSGRRPWILKCPDHVFALEALREVYPDARIVFLHRDPLKVLPSVAQLTEVLRAPFTTRIDRGEIGRQVTRDWVFGAERMVEASRDRLFPEAQVLHLQYRELVAQPLETIELLYDRFGLTLGSAASERIEHRIVAKPKGGYGHNVYSFAKHGLVPDELRQRFRDYTNFFEIEPETRRRSTAIPALPDPEPAELREPEKRATPPRAARLWTIAGGVTGAALGVGLLAYYGLDSVLSLLRNAGIGILPVIAFHITQLWLTGQAWRALGRSATPGTSFLMIRWIREGIGSLVPMGQVGGIAVAVRLLSRRGVPPAEAVATTVTDLSLEMATQIVFTLMGIAILLQMFDPAPLALPLVTGVVALLCMTGALAGAQWLGLGRIAERLARRSGRFSAIEGLHEAIIDTYRAPRRLAVAGFCHLLAWSLGSVEICLAFHALGHDVGLAQGFVIESLGQMFKAVSFAIPSALGVQEGGYVLICNLLGIPPDLALALSLIKRLRDVALGAPSIALWLRQERKAGEEALSAGDQSDGSTAIET